MSIVSDEYIDQLFFGTRFGEHVNESNVERRKLLAKTLMQQTEGYWSGRTIYNICVYGGFLIDAESCTNKKLTLLGEKFLQEQS